MPYRFGSNGNVKKGTPLSGPIPLKKAQWRSHFIGVSCKKHSAVLAAAKDFSQKF